MAQTPEERNAQLARGRESRLAKLRAARRAAKADATENPAEGSPVEGEQVAPVTPEAGEPSLPEPVEVAPAAPEPQAEHEMFAAASVFSTETLGRLAEAFEANEAVKEAFKLAVQEIVRDWENSKPDEAGKREHLYYLLSALRFFQTKIGRVRAGRRAAENADANLRIIR